MNILGAFTNPVNHTLDVSPAPIILITVGGSWFNSGIYKAQGGSVTFNSSSVETITSANNQYAFYNLMLFNGAGSWVSVIRSDHGIERCVCAERHIPDQWLHPSRRQAACASRRRGSSNINQRHARAGQFHHEHGDDHQFDELATVTITMSGVEFLAEPAWEPPRCRF